MYEALKALDITLITISLRFVFLFPSHLKFECLVDFWAFFFFFSSPFLMKYHYQLLTLHGPSGTEPGKWTLSRIGTREERMSIEREIKVLEEKLQEVEAWEKRVQELEVLLGVQEGIGEDEAAAKGEVEGDRDESEEALLREMEEKEEEEGEAAAAAMEEEEEGEGGVVEPDAESSSFVSASLGSLESDMDSSGVDLGEVGLEELEVGSQEAMVGVSEDRIVVDVGFEEAVDEEELEMEAGVEA